MRNLKDKIKNILVTITHPSYWIMNHEYDEYWESIFNPMLEKYEFDKFDDSMLSAYLGPYSIWIGNYPYACFHPWWNPLLFKSANYEVRPSRLTIYRAKKKLDRDYRKFIRNKMSFTEFMEEAINNARKL